MDVELLQGERIDDLQFKDLKLIQNPEYFSFGSDAVLLARFSAPKDNDSIIDLGSGTGIIPVMVSGLSASKRIVGIEIQDCMCDMFSRSVQLNSLEDRITVMKADIKDIKTILPEASFSLVISNPPYIKSGNGIVNDHSQKAISRHEVMCTLDDVCAAAGHLLSSKGRFSMVHKPERIVECFDSMRKYGIEPKRVQIIYPKADKYPSAMLIEGQKGAKPGLKFLKPIIIMTENGEYTASVQKIYADEGEDVFQ